MRRWGLVAAYVALLYLAVPFAREVVDALRGKGLLTGTLVGITLLALVGTCMLARGRRVNYLFALVPLIGLGAWALSLEVLEERIHLVQYSFLAILVHRVEPRLLRTFLIAAALGAGDEALQALVPSRVFDWRDVGFNVGAAALGTLLAAAISPRSSAPRAGSEGSDARPSP